MKSFATIAALLIASAVSLPLNLPRQAPIDAATIASLAPDLGAVPPLPPTGFGDCQGPVNGADGKPASVPCACPPTRDAFIAALTTNVLAGKAVNNTVVAITYPTGDSVADQQARITASAITLQNLVGPGKGCPLVSTTLGVQSKALQAGATGGAPNATPASTPAAPAASSAIAVVSSAAPAAPSSPAPATSAPATSGALTPELIAQLAADLGVSPPLAPTGRGDCVGPITGADGQPISVPCTCPPTKEAYIAALTTNVLAGKAVNNTDVKITFPTGSSVADQQGRITAAAITLQNLVGPGKGCPLVSTTLGVQSKALQAGTAASVTAAIPAATPAAPAVSSVAGALAVASSPAPAPVATAPAASGTLTPELIAQLAADLGVSPPLAPTGRGDCVGPITGADGQPISVPCTCPPTKDAYLAALTTNVLAGKAVNNTAVAITFPTGASVADQQARITAAAITLQNLVGPGTGCPLVSTTLGVQSKALAAGPQ